MLENLAHFSGNLHECPKSWGNMKCTESSCLCYPGLWFWDVIKPQNPRTACTGASESGNNSLRAGSFSGISLRLPANGESRIANALRVRGGRLLWASLDSCLDSSKVFRAATRQRRKWQGQDLRCTLGVPQCNSSREGTGQCCRNVFGGAFRAGITSAPCSWATCGYSQRVLRNSNNHGLSNAVPPQQECLICPADAPWKSN